MKARNRRMTQKPVAVAAERATSRNIDSLPLELIYTISHYHSPGYLNFERLVLLSNFSMVSKHFHELLKIEKEFVGWLLQYLTHGNLQDARKMYTQKPYLLFLQADSEEYAPRLFRGTPFQGAAATRDLSAVNDMIITIKNKYKISNLFFDQKFMQAYLDEKNINIYELDSMKQNIFSVALKQLRRQFPANEYSRALKQDHKLHSICEYDALVEAIDNTDWLKSDEPYLVDDQVYQQLCEARRNKNSDLFEELLKRNPDRKLFEELFKIYDSFGPERFPVGFSFNLGDLVKGYKIAEENASRWNNKQLLFYSLHVLRELGFFLTAVDAFVLASGGFKSFPSEFEFFRNFDMGPVYIYNQQKFYYFPYTVGMRYDISGNLILPNKLVLSPYFISGANFFSEFDPSKKVYRIQEILIHNFSENFRKYHFNKMECLWELERTLENNAKKEDCKLAISALETELVEIKKAEIKSTDKEKKELVKEKFEIIDAMKVQHDSLKKLQLERRPKNINEKFARDMTLSELIKKENNAKKKERERKDIEIAARRKEKDLKASENAARKAGRDRIPAAKRKLDQIDTETNQEQSKRHKPERRLPTQPSQVNAATSLFTQPTLFAQPHQQTNATANLFAQPAEFAQPHMQQLLDQPDLQPKVFSDVTDMAASLFPQSFLFWQQPSQLLVDASLNQQEKEEKSTENIAEEKEEKSREEMVEEKSRDMHEEEVSSCDESCRPGNKY